MSIPMPVAPDFIAYSSDHNTVKYDKTKLEYTTNKEGDISNQQNLEIDEDKYQDIKLD